MALIGPLASVNLFENKALTVSGGATPSAISSTLPTGMLSKLHVYVANTGTSTSVTINIYGKKNTTTLIKEHLAMFTLGAGSVAVPYSAGRYIEDNAIPSIVYAEIINYDASNVANVTVSLDRWR